jgi:hypothetical protein
MAFKMGGTQIMPPLEAAFNKDLDRMESPRMMATGGAQIMLPLEVGFNKNLDRMESPRMMATGGTERQMFSKATSLPLVGLVVIWEMCPDLDFGMLSVGKDYSQLRATPFSILQEERLKGKLEDQVKIAQVPGQATISQTADQIGGRIIIQTSWTTSSNNRQHCQLVSFRRLTAMGGYGKVRQLGALERYTCSTCG